MMADQRTGSEEPRYVGCLQGHTDWVTGICTVATDHTSDGTRNLLMTTSRDKTLCVWQYDGGESQMFADAAPGRALQSLRGHSQAVQDLALSSSARYAITASWDKSLRLWDLETGSSVRRFVGHGSDVNSVALSPDDRQIVSGSRDKTIKLWNTIGEVKYTIEENRHNDWVSCVRFSPAPSGDIPIVSCGWDKVVKVWDLQKCDLKTTLAGHNGPLYTVTISPDGSLCASGGKDGVAMLWDVNEAKHLYSLDAESTINALCFSPCHYWLCAATDKYIKIWNLENKAVLANIANPNAASLNKGRRPAKAGGLPWVTSLAWAADGNTLFAGSSDGNIYVYDLTVAA